MTIERRLSPEEEELLAKQAELENLADQLARKELDLQTIRAEIDAFFRYTVGKRLWSDSRGSYLSRYQ